MHLADRILCFPAPPGKEYLVVIIKGMQDRKGFTREAQRRRARRKVFIRAKAGPVKAMDSTGMNRRRKRQDPHRFLEIRCLKLEMWKGGPDRPDL